MAEPRYQPIRVTTTHSPDGFVVTGSDMPEGQLVHLLGHQRFVLARDQGGVLLELSYDMDGETLSVIPATDEQVLALGETPSSLALQEIARRYEARCELGAAEPTDAEALALVDGDRESLARIDDQELRASAILVIGYTADFSRAYRSALELRSPGLAVAAENAFVANERRIHGADEWAASPPDEPVDLEPLRPGA